MSHHRRQMLRNDSGHPLRQGGSLTGEPEPDYVVCHACGGGFRRRGLGHAALYEDGGRGVRERELAGAGSYLPCANARSEPGFCRHRRAARCDCGAGGLGRGLGSFNLGTRRGAEEPSPRLSAALCPLICCCYTANKPARHAALYNWRFSMPRSNEARPDFDDGKRPRFCSLLITSRTSFSTVAVQALSICSVRVVG